LLRDPERAREIGGRGRQLVEDAYTERHYVDKVQEVLLEAAPPHAER
jgi:hypothetical protein